MANASLLDGIDLQIASDETTGKGGEFANQIRGLGHDQQHMLNVIDNLRSGRVGDIKLPQIVVVGDQSAGKSSVLEAISGIPIPKDPQACTRLATEFRLRRGRNDISVSIIPSEDRDTKRRTKLSSIRYSAQDTTQLSELIRQCEDEIFEGMAGFASRDIIAIEISGPTMPLLTLVDLPGFIHTPNNKQTREDIAAIKDIAIDYMSRPRTIILAVVGGNAEYSNQVVLDIALKCDTRGTRTLGIVTKPDIASSLGHEDGFLKLVRNEDIKLDLGWHVLRNRAHQEKDVEASVRNQTEQEFFNQGKWGTLPAGTYGIESLVTKLSLLLYDHITEYFPQLLEEIKDELGRSEKELRGLGRPINTEPEMMTEIVTLFYSSKVLIKAGIRGFYYDHPDFFLLGESDNSAKASPRYLRTRVRWENTEFEREIRMRGCRVHFVEEGVADKEDDHEVANSDDLPLRVKMEDYETETVQSFLNIYAGQQLPEDYDPLIVYKLFDDYSANWDGIARTYIDRMQGITKEFLQEVVNYFWPQRMRERLWSTLLSRKIEMCFIQAKEELEKLLVDRQRCYPVYGPEYLKRLKEVRKRYGSSEISPAKGILQKMLVYYQLTFTTFVSNIIVQVAERHLINGLDFIFDITELHQMDNTTITHIAAEDPETRTKRDRLGQKVIGLRKAQEDCLAISMAGGQKKVRE
ncbi:hypothetical protein THAR02_08202 [Trichoderma harzianum]|uniref:Dynamin family protein n=1 Tax=Trichoderma harzianum TaxID=5544 RepID=A0A0F9X517_TRIHA|nr:hypothetical protein THAR02_08202 [Trichoderma harzianum]